MKKILGLDLGTNSIGWALVNEAETDLERSSIIKLGVRVNPLTVDEQNNFEQGKSITTNADRTLKRSMTEDNIMRKIRMIVIYTADIAPGQTRSNLDIGCLQFQLEEAFLTELDSVKIEDGIREKLNRGESLTAEEQMQFIILPLTYRGREKKEACIRRCFDMAKQVEDAQEQVFILSGILVFADKVIDNEDSKEMREWIMMTKVSKLFEEEKIEYGRKVAAEVSEKAAKATKEAVEKATRENEIGIVKRMLSNGIPLEQVKAVVTILTEEEVKDLQKEVKRQNNND